MPETEITALKVENGRVTGLEGRNARTGEPVDVRSKAVVVTTGGFNSNLDMVLEFNPRLSNDKVLEGSGRGSTGGGHKLVRQAGGYLTHMDHIWFYVYATPDYRDPAQRRGLVVPAWCRATSGSTSRAAAFTTRRCRAATPRAPR